MAEPRQTFTFRVPLEHDIDTREEIADDVIEFILRRTERGLDKNNKPFKRYSDSYAESKEFQIAGKSKNNVNLKLSGDMLTELEIINIQTPGFITIGYQSGEENDKAAWQRNNLQPNFPKRDFLGITEKDLKKILDRYSFRLESQKLEDRDRRQRIEEEAKRILSRFRL